MQGWDEFIKGVKKIKKKCTVPKQNINSIGAEKKFLHGTDNKCHCKKREASISQDFTESIGYRSITLHHDDIAVTKVNNEYITIDLHGYSIIEARDIVFHAVPEVAKSNLRTVLFITGKGYLRSQRSISSELAIWVEEDLSRYVIRSWVDPKSGGGARFVMLRRFSRVKSDDIF